MFNKILNELTLASDIAGDISPICKINGDLFDSDHSFISTLRAIVAPRMSETDTLNLRITKIEERATTLKELSEKDSIEVLSNGIEENTLSICGFFGTENNVSTSIKIIDKSFKKIYPEFKELKDLREFVSAQSDMRFYINEKTKNTIIFVASLDMRLYHYIQSFTSRILPWYFEERPLEDCERELVKSLIIKSSTRYERLIEEFAAKYDFRSKKIERMLGGFEKESNKKRLQTIRSDVSAVERSVDENVARYRDLIRKREQLLIEQAGILSIINNDNNGSELVEYFMCNKNIHPINTYEDTLSFIVSCTLENFDIEMYERISSNFGGYFYEDYDVTNDVFIPAETRKRFMDAIFCDEPLLKVKMCGFYTIALSGWVDTESYYNYPREFADRVPNPHLNRHHCLGNQKPLIERYLRDGDKIGAVEQCVCSAQSINVGESATFPYLLKELFSSNCADVMLLPDGTSCTPTEALKWLDELAGNGSQTENNTEVSE